MARSTAGRVVRMRIDSRVLRDNPLGDPAERDLFVYLPAGYDASPSRRYPVVLVLSGFSGFGEYLFQRRAFEPTLADRLDRLVATRKMPPVIAASPDCYTALGGSQYVDSSAVGDYETHVVREVVPFLDASFRTKAAPRHRAIAGKSSGGYGAIMLAMKHPEVFGAVATHSGDAYFDYCYRFDFVKCWNAVRDAGGVQKWLARFRSAPRARSEDVLALNVIAMAACYSPNPRSKLGFDLPFDLETGEEVPEVMERWRRFDPVVACRRYAANLRKLRGIFVDCGLRDEFALHAGARILVRRLRELGLRPVHEEFDDGHFSIGYRYDRSMPRLAKWIA